jgi:hypothetical protein
MHLCHLTTESTAEHGGAGRYATSDNVQTSPALRPGSCFVHGHLSHSRSRGSGVKRFARCRVTCRAWGLQVVGGAADGSAAAVEHVRVDHRRADIGVAEELLDSADVVARLEQLAREALAQSVWRDRLCDLRRSRSLPHRALAAALVQVVTANGAVLRVAPQARRGEEPARLPTTGWWTLRNRFKNAFAQIDVQLKRRYDLIPNLVETAKGYMKHERETLEAVIAARNRPRAEQRRPPTPATRRHARADGRRGRAHRRARAPLRAGRGLPGPQGQPEHDAAPGGADLHREQGRLRAPGLQRRGDDLQHRHQPTERAAPKVSFT